MLRRKNSSTSDRQPAAVEHRAGDVGDGSLDEVALVDDRDDLDLGEGRVDRLDLGQDLLGDLDGVGVGLLADGHPQAAARR